ncbi:MAG: hypothetical protein HOV68_08115 [Streptomycetaceae bacterium]|nr:hypothetical protein [Streptomycetaceae bacterium]
MESARESMRIVAGQPVADCLDTPRDRIFSKVYGYEKRRLVTGALNSASNTPRKWRLTCAEIRED